MLVGRNYAVRDLAQGWASGKVFGICSWPEECKAALDTLPIAYCVLSLQVCKRERNKFFRLQKLPSTLIRVISDLKIQNDGKIHARDTYDFHLFDQLVHVCVCVCVCETRPWCECVNLLRMVPLNRSIFAVGFLRRLATDVTGGFWWF